MAYQLAVNVMMEAEFVERAILKEMTFLDTRMALWEFYPVSTVPAADFLPLVSGVADIASTHGYVFEEMPDETAMLDSLCAQIGRGDADLQLIALCIITCYRPLNSVLNPAQIAALKDLHSREVDLWLARYLEKDMEGDAEAIETVTGLVGEVSGEVAAQYDRDPFPPAYAYPLIGRPSELGLRGLMAGIFPQLAGSIEDVPHEFEAIDIGCGRGPGLLNVANDFPAGKFLGVDLSKKSLAMAKRDAGRLGIDNVRFAQADLLGLDAYPKRFDLAMCGGVLHHLPQREKAWEVLTGLVKPGGFIHAAVYSKRAREPIYRVKEEIARWGLTDDIVDLRLLRTRALALAALGNEDFQFLLRCEDFDYRSGLRDLLFHPHEYPYTLPELGAIFDRNGLEFLGFQLDHRRGGTLERYRAIFPHDKNATDLQNWDYFESHNPGTFFNMYNFCLRKKR